MATPHRSLNALNLHLTPNIQFTSSGFPIIRATDYIPSRIIPFNHIYTVRNTDAGVHFFIDDYQFERIWNFPTRYLNRLKQFNCIFTPDFSLYTDMPTPIKIWNTYRSRLIGAWLYQQGITVIPTVSWADVNSFAYCFDGLPSASTLAVSTIGTLQNNHCRRLWLQGINQMIKRLQPSTILLYGSKIDFNNKNIPIHYYNNTIIERLRNLPL